MINPDFIYALVANGFARIIAIDGVMHTMARAVYDPTHRISWPGIRACLLQYCNQLFFDHAWSCLDVSEFDTGALTLAIPRLATAISVSSLQMVVRIIDENRRGQNCRNNQPIAKA
jgi:hypothetical protein